MDHHWQEQVQRCLGYRFGNAELLKKAFTHASYAYRYELDCDNERLEFLGDSVLGFVVAADLFQRFPGVSEGALTRAKAYMTHSDVLTGICETLGLHRFLLVDENDPSIRDNPKLQENLLEAVIGALYLDGGLDVARSFIFRVLDDTGNRVQDVEQVVFDYKTRLQEFFQAAGLEPPDYVIVNRSGPVHDAIFTAELRFRGKALSSGTGRSKKQAHQECARQLLNRTSDGEKFRELLHADFPDIPAGS